VTLLKELRDAWGKKYGISATLPSSYWYLRWFDLKGLEKHLDWLNMMSYDIHVGLCVVPRVHDLTDVRLRVSGTRPTNLLVPTSGLIPT
jgi:hypothetical protein